MGEEALPLAYCLLPTILALPTAPANCHFFARVTESSGYFNLIGNFSSIFAV
jgi:hypothetical protein